MTATINRWKSDMPAASGLEVAQS
ncbi:hypothetical protein RB2654_15285 [Rhodobacterales bacterium HTCC2654]|uniref:Uncharacterized protein n=1 Tax=Maritimibacter alkaliphilus HTCC2654 TaxID=314271 RepID=A3VHA6_9RHOB|nr:hypothetical protein RB2654_15285 [Rhodobacterales bacterium HTCC2654] [Maritimibacter alkaliphilus HTCC2654]